MKMTVSLEKKNYVNLSKGAHKQRLCNLQKSLLLVKIIHCFQRKTPKCKYWVLKVLYLENQMLCTGWLKNDSLCLRLQCSSECCVAVNVMDWDLTYKDLMKLILSCQLSISIKIYLRSLSYQHHSQECFF